MANINRYLFSGYTFAALALLTVYNLTGSGADYIALAFLGTAATATGLMVNRPAKHLPWIFLTIGMLLWAVGDVLWFAPGIEGPDTYPSSADYVYLVGYPFFIVALGILLWAGDKEFRKAGLLDVAMITTAIGMIVWIKGVAPTIQQGLLNASFMTSLVYLLLDLLLVGVALKLLLTRTRRTTSSGVLTVGLMTLLFADLATWFYVPAEGTLGMHLMDSSWLISYIAVGMAALHPSMARDDRDAQEPPEHLTTLRMILLGVVAVVGPLILIPDALDDNEYGLLGVIIGIGLFFVFDLLRMSGLFRRTERINRDLEIKSEELQHAELRLRTLLEQSPAISFIGEDAPPRRLRFISPQCKTILGYEPSELTGVPDVIPKFVHPDDLDRLLPMINMSQPGGEVHAEVRMVRKDGTPIWIHAQAKLIESSADGLEWHGLLLDISDRARVRELETSLEREQEAVERLEKLDEMKNTFLQAVSHELRTPLTTVRGLAATLRARMGRLDQSQVADLVERIDSGAARLQRLLGNLLDVDRLSRGVFIPAHVESDVGELVGRTARRILGESILVHIDITREIAWVDPSKVERIVENLCANARKHASSDAEIWVSVRSVAGGVLIEVADSGLGVPDDFKETIFEVFNQGRSASSHSQGLGLGLSLVRKFAELHGGRAWVDDRRGGGACFKVILPRVPPSMNEEGTEHSTLGQGRH